LDLAGFLVVLVFVVAYTAITSEKVNRTAMSLTGMAIVAMIVWVLLGSSFRVLTEHIGWYTVLFVTGQMIIVGISRASGMYQYLALKLALPSGGNPRHLFITFLVFVFFISLFFDTTSTMLIVGPITIEICRATNLDIKPFLVSEAIVANFASIPSVVGDVPNLVVANSIPGFSPGFQFITLMPLSFILLIISLPIMIRYFERSMTGHDIATTREVLRIDPTSLIRSKLEFYMSIGAMIALALAFTVGIAGGLEPSLASISIAAVMLLFTQRDVDAVLRQVGWGTVFFVIGIFGIVAALDITGVLAELAAWVSTVVAGDKTVVTLFMVWIPGLLSSVIDNVPIAALLAPIALEVSSISPLLPIALIFGVNVGAFVLPIGSPANIIALALSEAEDDRIGMWGFAKLATPIALLMMLVGTGWLLLLGALLP